MAFKLLSAQIVATFAVSGRSGFDMSAYCETMLMKVVRLNQGSEILKELAHRWYSLVIIDVSLGSIFQIVKFLLVPPV